MNEHFSLTAPYFVGFVYARLFLLIFKLDARGWPRTLLPTPDLPRHPGQQNQRQRQRQMSEKILSVHQYTSKSDQLSAFSIQLKRIG
jgi:hypothetical protein